jgi:predicted PolB exonuclease-like 3'-5' exonuclease
MPEPLKPIKPEVWIFDIETVPCADTIRRIYQLGSVSDADATQFAFNQAGATLENPHPFLKTVMHQVVCISMLIRRVTREGIKLELHTLPKSAEPFPLEKEILQSFFTQVGTRKPQLVGFNSSGFDLSVLYQRAIIHELEIKLFCQRPDKPWDAKPDYFSAANDWNVDLVKTVGGWGKETPSLVEICRACGIPAKQGTDGSDVLKLWLNNEHEKIARYCESDVFATYRLWLRLAIVAGLLTLKDAVDEEIHLMSVMNGKT